MAKYSDDCAEEYTQSTDVSYYWNKNKQLKLRQPSRSIFAK